MDDIFAVDDAQVDVVRRSRGHREGSFGADDVDEYTVPERTIAARNETGDATSDVENYNFDYVSARPRIRSPAVEPFDLGLDDEVVVKRRAPQAKLDDERLLGPLGIPKIRDDLRKRIRFRGKGHELQDLGKFIEMYQFWAHDLFPKAKFRDALKMISKVGKTKKMKAQRRQIIDDILPRPEYQEPSSDEDGLEIAAPRAATGTSVEVAAGIYTTCGGDEYGDDLEMPAQGAQGIANDIPEEMPLEEVDDLDDADALEAMGIMI
ncbi:protein of unknown function [Taphrina deformans PYCC 5710]|uniref:Chromosome segregation in meiosis protein n=1 Tax=Taphrina deformans (strain PYCC 5710 / ATCC 11124 / CBS 356.35 / IMI 108563 / JCM 9778 / NBRC 8474) TaxID=1097556 RepID=R4XDV8_TAPDE|nr:protein of unknown function [Taphrina deformans PYCC 5710]|eukprot:CCG84056.1 protein of unknown function [Taphrina deformans PYCC 5710]